MRGYDFDDGAHLTNGLNCVHVFLARFDAATKSESYSLPLVQAPIGYIFPAEYHFCYHIVEMREY